MPPPKPKTTGRGHHHRRALRLGRAHDRAGADRVGAQGDGHGLQGHRRQEVVPRGQDGLRQRCVFVRVFRFVCGERRVGEQPTFFLSTDACYHTCTTGSDWFERGVSRPDLMLKDFIKVIHPELDAIETHEVMTCIYPSMCEMIHPSCACVRAASHTIPPPQPPDGFPPRRLRG